MSCSTHLCGDYISYIKDVRGFADATVRTYAYVLNGFIDMLGDVEPGNLTIEQIDLYIAAFTKARQLKPSSINTVRCVLRSYFQYVDRYRGIRLNFDYSMIRQIKAPRSKIDVVGTEELTDMIRHLKTPQDKLMMLTMYGTGMRIGELVRFVVEDYSTTEIRVRGKGGKDRVIPIDPMLSKLLQEYIYSNRIKSGPVFRHATPKVSLPNQAFSVSGLRKRWQRQLGPEGMYKKPHSLRHGVATSLLMDGMDIRTLQTFLGHSHIATTMLYTHITDTHLREAFLKHDPLRQLNTSNILDI